MKQKKLMHLCIIVLIILLNYWHQVCYATRYEFSIRETPNPEVATSLSRHDLHITATASASASEETTLNSNLLQNTIRSTNEDISSDTSSEDRSPPPPASFNNIYIHGSFDIELHNVLSQSSIRATNLHVINLRTTPIQENTDSDYSLSHLSPPSAVVLGIPIASNQPHNMYNMYSSAPPINTRDTEHSSMQQIRPDIQITLLLANTLRVNRLYLEHNHLDDVDAFIISDNLSTNLNHLRSLYLAYNSISHTGAEHLAAAIANPNTRLQHLSLRQNPIGIIGHEAFTRTLLSGDNQLRELDLANTLMRGEALPNEDWADVISNTRLKVIHLKNMMPPCSSALQEALTTGGTKKKLLSLRALYIYDNNFNTVTNIYEVVGEIAYDRSIRRHHRNTRDVATSTSINDQESSANTHTVVPIENPHPPKNYSSTTGNKKKKKDNSTEGGCSIS